jgi:HSP20 family protein
MARSNQSDQDRSRDSSSMGSTSDSAGSAAERQKDIETARDRGGQRGKLSRPLTGSVEGEARPFTLMRRLTDDLDQLFGQFGFGRLTVPNAVAAWSPQIETFQRNGKLIVRADLPGLNKDDVDVEVNDGVLTISGERKEEHEEDRDGYYRSERSYGRFYRAISLPDGVDEGQCEASFKDGVLEISFDAPKPEQRKARKIQVR